MFYSGFIKLLYPVALQTGKTAVRFGVDGNFATVDFATSKPLKTNDVFLVGTGSEFTVNGVRYRPILTEIEDALEAEFSSYTFEFHAADVDPEINTTGLELRVTSGSPSSITWDFDHADFTLNPAFLGWSDSPAVASASGVSSVTSPFSYRGGWHWNAGRVTTPDLRQRHSPLVMRSRMDRKHGYANAWEPRPQDNPRQAAVDRKLHLRDLPAARVLPERAQIPDLAQDAGLADDGNGNYDPNAQFEHVFRAVPNGNMFLYLKAAPRSVPVEVDYPGDARGVEMVQFISSTTQDLRSELQDYGTPGETYTLQARLAAYSNDGIPH